MALNQLGQWQIVRQIIAESKTGTLTVRFGRSYQHWILRRGEVTQVSSTLREQSLTHFLRDEFAIHSKYLQAAQNEIDDRQTLGFVLLQHRILTEDELAKLVTRHFVSQVFTLLRTSASLFWSDHASEPKPRTVEIAVPIRHILLQAERTCIELHPSVRFVEEFPGKYRSFDVSEAQPLLSTEERRVLEYVKSGASFDKILRDPELDRLTCYRTVFLLWLTAHLSVEQPQNKIAVAKNRIHFLHRLQSIPPEWIFPFLVGLLLGILTVPKSAPPDINAMQPPARIEQWHDWKP